MKTKDLFENGKGNASRGAKGRNNSNDQINSAAMVEGGNNALLAAEEIREEDPAENSAENSAEKNSAENSDALRVFVINDYKSKIAASAKVAELESALAAAKLDCLVSALRDGVADSYKDSGISADAVSALFEDGLNESENFQLDWVSSVENGITIKGEKTYNNGKQTRYGVFNAATTPVAIIARWRSFCEMSRLMSRPSYAPFAAIDAKNRASRDMDGAFKNAAAKMSKDELRALLEAQLAALA